jgi:nucleoside-diphosphate-sugar epimerase
MAKGGISLGGSGVKSQRVLLTGHRGYIGSVLIRHLLERGHRVIGLDTGYFNACHMMAAAAEPEAEIAQDIRDIGPGDLEDIDAVIHLAALSNDPIGNLNPRWTQEINVEATTRLAELAKQAGVRRFLFSSSCIMYGTSKALLVEETAPLNPRTDYARSKVAAERMLAQLTDGGFAATMLRNGTVYGPSPSMRLDTVFNCFVGSAVARGEVAVQSSGRPWRPVVHVEDVSRAFGEVLEAPLEAVAGEAFNVGADHLNHQVIGLARLAAEAVPGARVVVRDEPGADERTYRASFAKWTRAFPDFEWQWSCRRGAEQLRDAFLRRGLDQELFQDPRWVRLQWLKTMLNEQKLNATDLRWARERVRVA